MALDPSAHARDISLSGGGARLESWKAIAEYLGRHVTTVQRWEQDEGLPVRRLQHDKRGSIYAFTSDLDAWLAARTVGGPVGTVESVSEPTTDESPASSVPPAPARLPGVQVQAGRHDGSRTSTAGPTKVRREFVAAVVVLAAVAASAWLLNRQFPARGPSAEAQSLAVLPLENRSPDQQPDYVVDGMTEALITDLASLPALRVIARQSVMQYRHSGKPAADIAHELGVDVLVEGAVQRSGERVRVDIRLIDGGTSRSRWGTTYERGAADALSLQSEISRAIASELRLELEPGDRARMAGRRPVSADAWDAYLRARFFWNKRTEDAMGKAIEWYERAIARDPNFALAYAGLADVYASVGPPRTAGTVLIDRGTRAAEKAIELDPGLGEPLAALGKLRGYAWDWDGAEKFFRAGIDRSPGYPPGRYWYGSFLANLGRCEEALSQAREAERLDPVSLSGNMVVSSIEIRCRRVDEAIARNQMILELDPGYGPAYEFLGRAYLMRGEVARALPLLEKAVALSGDRATTRAALAAAYARAGRTKDAEAIATDLERRHRADKQLASAWSIAVTAVAMSRDDAALEWLEHAFEDREEWLQGLAVDERFERLHPQPRFQHLLHQLRLPGGSEGLVALR